jgi:hypothetical protein
MIFRVDNANGCYEHVLTFFKDIPMRQRVVVHRKRLGDAIYGGQNVLKPAK